MDREKQINAASNDYLNAEYYKEREARDPKGCAYDEGYLDGFEPGLLSGFDAGARWADEHPRWISVEDELPKEDGTYLFFDAGTQGVHVGYFWADLELNENVTHWMPLPSIETIINKQLCVNLYHGDYYEKLKGGEQ